VDGIPVHPEQVGVHIVSPRHFETIGAEISRGRELRDGDRSGAPLSVVITDRLAARLWPGGDPIGRQLEVFTANRSLDGMRTVVGVVKPIRFNVDDDPGLDVYLPIGQVFTASVMVFIKGSIDHGQALAALSREVAQLDSRAPVHDPASLESRLSSSLAAERLLAAALMGLGAMAVLLAVVCTYTLTAQTVASAQHELAIRRALGATAATVGRLVAVRASVIAAAGALVGTGLAFAGARVLASLLHGTPRDHPVLFLAPVVMIAALGAALIGPVRQAVRVNILLAMRER
jgi:putative ABC transport system permease protein